MTEKTMADSGWVMVPREPTEAMKWAGDEAAETCVKDDPCGKAAEHIWADMLAAAPEPPRADREAVARIIDPGAWDNDSTRAGVVAWENRRSKAFAKAEAILALLPARSDRVKALVEALDGFADDYITSEIHHPGYVLIPTEKFECIRAALLPDTKESEG